MNNKRKLMIIFVKDKEFKVAKKFHRENIKL